jgi:hypothetical protein
MQRLDWTDNPKLPKYVDVVALFSDMMRVEDAGSMPVVIAEDTITKISWTGCYDGSWQSAPLVAEAYAHPVV